MSNVTKAIIPVAGLGTRVLPASKAIPKEMLTVVDKPVIQHVVEEAVGAGFTDIILVTRSNKSAIEDHFDSNYELEKELSRKGKDDILKSITDIIPAHVTVSAVRQHNPLGLGHAVLCAAKLINNQPFAVLLPDMLVHNSAEQHCSDLALMVKRFEQDHAAQIMVEHVPTQQVSQYGIIDCQGADLSAGMFQPVKAMVEKPSIDTAPSNQAIIGRYILPARVMEILETTPPGAGNEIQLTDALDRLISESKVEAFSMTGKTYDCGNKAGFLQANAAFGLSHPELGESYRGFLSELLKTIK